MTDWYYAREGEPCGPVSEPELVKGLETGKLDRTTLVWTEGMAAWTAACEVHGLMPSAEKPILPPILRRSVPSEMAPPHPTSRNQVRPWVRYWARMMDFLLSSILVGVPVACLYAPALKMPDVVLTMLMVFAFVFVESAMLAAWGTTPGKALLRVRLRRSDGRRLSYADALGRAFSVWLRGMGLGIPLISLITLARAHKRLTERGITSWDEAGRFTVTHRTVGAWRTVVTVLIFVGFISLMILGASET